MIFYRFTHVFFSLQDSKYSQLSRYTMLVQSISCNINTGVDKKIKKRK